MRWEQQMADFFYITQITCHVWQVSNQFCPAIREIAMSAWIRAKKIRRWKDGILIWNEAYIYWIDVTVAAIFFEINIYCHNNYIAFAYKADLNVNSFKAAAI